MVRTACTEHQCLYKGDLYLYFYGRTYTHFVSLSLSLLTSKSATSKLQANITLVWMFRAELTEIDYSEFSIMLSKQQLT